MWRKALEFLLSLKQQKVKWKKRFERAPATLLKSQIKLWYNNEEKNVWMCEKVANHAARRRNKSPWSSQ